MRAVLVALLVTTPSLLLPGVDAQTAEIISLAALIAAGMTFIEYFTNFPTFVEFRDAPPINRIRFVALFAMVFVLTVICKQKTDPTTLTAMLTMLGTVIGNTLDFPYSPVRLALLTLPDTASYATVEAVRIAAGVAYLIAVIAVLAFFYVVRVMGWPTSMGAFNVWVNLPLFDPTGGGDVVHKLQRDGRINIILGVLLPFMVPALVKLLTSMSGPLEFSQPQALIWAACAWAFIPASMVMRGIAMLRIGDLIEEKRRRAYANSDAAQTA